MSVLDLGVVILNWNGAADTIACLRSVYAQPSVPGTVVLVDNGSTEGSVAALREWLRAHMTGVPASVPSDRAGTVATAFTMDLAGGPRIVFVENRDNLGFASGNNVGLRLLGDRHRYAMLLNNDTELGRDALGELVRAMDATPNAECMVPQIRYAGAPDMIWNCGGDWMWWGVPRYRFEEAPASALDGHPPFEVGFVTGCALILRSSWLQQHGLLTERFFFGEEDVELSWRMRQGGARAMLCWPAAVVYHKVGTSISRTSAHAFTVPRDYCHYLNRLIFLRLAWGRGPRWQGRRAVAVAYAWWRLIRRFRFAAADAYSVARDLARDAGRLDGVSAAYFHHLIGEKFDKWKPRPDTVTAESAR